MSDPRDLEVSKESQGKGGETTAGDEAARLLSSREGLKKAPVALPEWSPITTPKADLQKGLVPPTGTSENSNEGRVADDTEKTSVEGEKKAQFARVTLEIPNSSPEMPRRAVSLTVKSELANHLVSATELALLAKDGTAEQRQQFFQFVREHPIALRTHLHQIFQSANRPELEPVIDQAYMEVSREETLQRSEQISNPEVKARMINLVQRFEERAQAEGLKAGEVMSTLNSVNRILREPGSFNLSETQRQSLAEQILFNASRPDSIYSGDVRNNPVAVLEQRVYSQNPASAAKLVADIALKGSYVAKDNSSISTSPWPDRSAQEFSLTAGNGEVESKSEHHRSWASQIFQNTAINAKYEKDLRHDGSFPSVFRYQRVEGEDGVERDTLVRYGVDSEGRINIEKYSHAPYIQPEDLNPIHDRIVGYRSRAAQGTEGFAIIGPVVEGVDDQLIKNEQSEYNKSDVKVVTSAQELTDHIRALESRQALPAPMLVSRTHPIFRAADGTVPGDNYFLNILREKQFGGESYVEYSDNGKTRWLKTSDLFNLSMPVQAEGNTPVTALADSTRSRSGVQYEVSKELQRSRETALSLEPNGKAIEASTEVGLAIPSRDGGSSKEIKVAVPAHLKADLGKGIDLAFRASADGTTVQQTADWFSFANEHPVALKQSLIEAAEKSGDADLLRVVREAYAIKDVQMIEAPARETILNSSQSEAFLKFIESNASLLADPRSYASFRLKLFTFLNNNPELGQFAQKFGQTTEHGAIAGALDYYYGTDNVNRFGLVTAIDAMGGRRTMSVTGRVLEARTAFGDQIHYDREGQLSKLILQDGGVIEEKSPGKWVKTSESGESSTWWNGKIEAERDGSLRYTDEDGKSFIQRLDQSTETRLPSGRVVYDNLDPNIERLVAKRLAERFQDPEAGERFSKLIDKFEARVESAKVSEFQAAQTYHQIRRLLETPNSRALTAGQTEILAEQILFNAAHPATPTNGCHSTCAAGALERRINERNPGDAARLVVDMVVDGRYVAADGSIFTQPVWPDLEARQHKLELNGDHVSFNGSRSWASQIFQGVATNLAHVDPASSAEETYRFGRVENYRGAEIDALMRHRNGAIEVVGENPYVHSGTIEAIERKIVGEINANGELVGNKGFVFMGPQALGEDGKVKQLSAADFPDRAVQVMQSAEQLLEEAKQAQTEGKMPLILVVSRSHAELAGPTGAIQGDVHTVTLHKLVQHEGRWWFEYADGRGNREWMTVEDTFKMTTIDAEAQARAMAERPAREMLDGKNLDRTEMEIKSDGTRQIVDPESPISKMNWKQRLTEEELRGMLETKKVLEERVTQGEKLSAEESKHLEFLRYVEGNVNNPQMHQKVIEHYGNSRPKGGFKASQMTGPLLGVGIVFSTILHAASGAQAAEPRTTVPRARYAP